MNYERLIGKVIIDKANLSGHGANLVVSEIDEDLGITLHEEGEPSQRVLCLVHPDILHQRTGVPRSRISIVPRWPVMFAILAGFISLGYLPRTYVGLSNTSNISAVGPTTTMADICPFT